MPRGLYQRRPAEERFWSKVQKTETCWLWTGAKELTGYGATWMNRRKERAHRVAYILMVGAIPADLELDHLCRVPACVNPAHLEPVTHRENILRGINPPAVAARRTHCQHGHPYSADNLFHSRRGDRLCRTCSRERAKQYYYREKVLERKT